MASYKTIRRAEKRAQQERELEASARERDRLAQRSLFEKIEDATTIGDIKEILHEIRDRLEIEP